MKDAIMLLSSALFAIVFSFLVLVFSIFVISRFFKAKIRSFEPKISIVVPAYNEEKNIQECMNSIFNSGYPLEKMEVIVVDDGSKDSTMKILSRNRRIKAISQNHKGKVEALNLGVLSSSNEFIVTLDADTCISESCIRELVSPFSDEKIGASTGNNIVKNSNSILCTFQNVEYHFTNLARNSFSTVFNDTASVAGSLACYRKSALKKINYFKKDTLAEDVDIALELRKAGYRTIVMPEAFGHTVVPTKLRELYKQRFRWWLGTLQAISKNKDLFSRKSSPSILYFYISHVWWSFYAFLSLPLIIYQINYWMPYNSQTIFSSAGYFFRWFSLMGPIYVLYKIPEWGVSLYAIFGVLSGIMMTILSVAALRIFKEKISFRNMFAIFFYFPYTIVLNIIILASLLRHKFWERSFYIK